MAERVGFELMIELPLLYTRSLSVHLKPLGHLSFTTLMIPKVALCILYTF